uniref:Uncharacterized protein n=1 Tax=Rangifer tarandus platyrhynchus TaxID=3082113 RepID=A0ACB0FGE4_RANTA|nr:unnamed protein product [Rangifer tarandus platyrhynchus]
MRASVDRKRLERLCNRYKDPQDENKIGIDGIQQFCDDLSLDPASITVLLIAWKFRAATQCEFSEKEFVDGMTELGCDSAGQLKALLPGLERELKDTVRFQDLYQFTFTFARSPGQKGLENGAHGLGPGCLTPPPDCASVVPAPVFTGRDPPVTAAEGRVQGAGPPPTAGGGCVVLLRAPHSVRTSPSSGGMWDVPQEQPGEGPQHVQQEAQGTCGSAGKHA